MVSLLEFTLLNTRIESSIQDIDEVSFGLLLQRYMLLSVLCDIDHDQQTKTFLHLLFSWPCSHRHRLKLRMRGKKNDTGVTPLIG